MKIDVRPTEHEGKKTISFQLQETVEEFCNDYCKYPYTWDEEKEGCELSQSDICANCPLNRI